MPSSKRGAIVLAGAALALLALAVAWLAVSVPHVVESSSALQAARVARGLELYADPGEGAATWIHPPLAYIIIGLVLRVSDADPVLAGRALNAFVVLVAFAALGVRAKRNGRSIELVLAVIVWALASLHALDLRALWARCDGVANALALGAALAGLPGLEKRNARLLVLAQALAVAAVFAKQTFVWLPLFFFARAVVAKDAKLVLAAALGAIASAVPLVVLLLKEGDHALFYVWTVPAAEPRLASMVGRNLWTASPVIATGLLFLVQPLGELDRVSRRRELARASLELPIVALAAGTVFASKIGARGDAFLPFVCLAALRFLEPGVAGDVLERRWVRRRPFVLPAVAVALGLIAGARNVADARASSLARAAWLDEVRAALSRKVSRGHESTEGAWWSEAIVPYRERRILEGATPEPTINVAAARPEVVPAFARALARREDVIVLSETWEYADALKDVEGELERAGFEVAVTLDAQEPNSAFAGWIRPRTRVYVKK